jgi:pilus assembly protein Flp/PilA
MFQRFLREKDAATAVEYAVMLAMILLLCIGAVAMVGKQARSMWSDNETGLKSAFTP